MSWENELYSVYETQCGREFDGEEGITPIYHSKINADIEVTVNEDGDFVNAKFLVSNNKNKELNDDTVTYYPITDESAGRSGTKPPPHPFMDQFKYLAGDYSPNEDGKKPFYEKAFKQYIQNLKKWCESDYSHPSIEAVYKYLSKETLHQDLLRVCGGQFKSSKIEKYFVRFIVNYRDFSHESQTWRDEELRECHLKHISSQEGSEGLCYATGKILPITYNHPKISGNGKIISANDKYNFTFRGRFADKFEAFAVSIDFTQKMHNALKWLIGRQRIELGSITLVVWTSILQQQREIEKITKNELRNEEEDDFSMEFLDEEIPIDTGKAYAEYLEERIYGIKDDFKANSKVMMLGLEASSNGRMSVSVYQEVSSSDFLQNILKWHNDTGFRIYDGKSHSYKVISRSAYTIICHAFAAEINGKISFTSNEKKKCGDLILRLLPCITQGRKLPVDIVRAICQKASNPLAYDEKAKNHRKVLETACGLIRKNNIDRKKGVITMAYDPNETDRSYLYGCLLAIADAAERNTYEKSESDRVTNARRYWSAFAQRPWTTWKIIEGNLRPYLDKKVDSGKHTGIYYDKKLGEIMDKMSISEYENDSALSPNYLLGYHHFSAEIYKPSTKKTEEE